MLLLQLVADMVVPVVGCPGHLFHITLRLPYPPPDYFCFHPWPARLAFAYGPLMFAAVIGTHLQVHSLSSAS